MPSVFERMMAQLDAIMLLADAALRAGELDEDRFEQDGAGRHQAFHEGDVGGQFEVTGAAVQNMIAAIHQGYLQVGDFPAFDSLL